MASLKREIKMLKLALMAMALVIAGLVLYITYPSIKIAVNGQPFGSRLTAISMPLSGDQLSIINNAPNTNFEIAGEKLLNLSIPGEQSSNNTYTAPLFEATLQHPLQSNSPLVIEGKPSVVYIGAISCIYCAESRWSMALALSRFGSFNKLYTGYSALGDGDVPTLYWINDNYTSKGTPKFGNGYSSNYINFFSTEYDSPITSGFQFPQSQNPIVFFTSNAPNSTYKGAMEFMNRTMLFQGTPFTLWGSSLNRGAAGVVFGNSTTSPNQTTGATNLPALTYMSHSQIFDQLRSPSSTFAYEEYAVADVYIAEICPSISNSAPVCSLPAIKSMEQKMGLA